MTKTKEQMKEVDVSTEEQIKAGLDLAQVLVDIDAEKANIKAERDAHKETLAKLEVRRDHLRGIVLSGKKEIPAQTSLVDPDEIQRKDVEELGELILSRLDDLPEAATEFSADIKDKVENILLWIDENDKATPAQLRTFEELAIRVDEWEENNAD